VIFCIQVFRFLTDLGVQDSLLAIFLSRIFKGNHLGLKGNSLRERGETSLSLEWAKSL
jgi:hypothetical protein